MGSSDSHQKHPARLEARSPIQIMGEEKEALVSWRNREKGKEGKILVRLFYLPTEKVQISLRTRSA